MSEPETERRGGVGGADELTADEGLEGEVLPTEMGGGQPHRRRHELPISVPIRDGRQRRPSVVAARPASFASGASGSLELVRASPGALSVRAPAAARRTPQARLAGGLVGWDLRAS
ncbi:MAG: hypothetical protein ACXQTZ_04330 [Candidatus Alkanophagales archaeon]